MVPVSNHLMDTESGFAPWDLSKAHILVSTPAKVLFSKDIAGTVGSRRKCRIASTL